MSFENLEDMFTLFCTVVGLLCCMFKYIEIPKRGYLYLIIFFSLHFISDYHYMIYTFLMHSTPYAQEFLVNLGWYIGFVFLFLSIFEMQQQGSRRFFHPLMLWPILTNIPQFLLYIRFGGIIYNIWEVGWTTLIMIICTKEVIYFIKSKKARTSFPYLAALILAFVISEYGLWTSSCFDWSSEIKNPYLYISIIGAFITIFFAWGADMHYKSEEQITIDDNRIELGSQASIQTITSLVVFGGCVAGYYIASILKNRIPSSDSNLSVDYAAIVFYIISLVLIILILVLLFLILHHYKVLRNRQPKKDLTSRSRANLIITIIITFALMSFAVAYNTWTLYEASVVAVYEDCEDKIKMTATDLENYLAVAETTLRVTADTVDLMEKNGDSSQAMLDYLTKQTNIQSEQFDENFTGIYAYIDGVFMDGSGWVPPEGYDPESRDWYQPAVDANGEVIMISPYVDVETGSVVITIAKRISDGEDENGVMRHNVVCLDVIVNHVKEVIAQTDVADKGYAMIVNYDGFIVAHHDVAYNGQNINDIYDKSILNNILATRTGSFKATIDEDKSTLFVYPIMDQWYVVIVVNSLELIENVHSQLAVNIMVFLISFLLISFFYYLGYKSEQNYSRKVDDINLQVVSALAAAIDAKDNYTNGHSSRVAMYAKMIAKRAGYSEEKQDEIYMMLE